MADRYWVGGTANWDGTAGTKWATTSGGAGGASVPTSADDVFFDSKPAPTWQASTAYVLTNIVSPVTGNGRHYECTTAGTTGATEPTWPTTVGNTVTSGTAVFTCRSATCTVVSGGGTTKAFNCTGFTGTITGASPIFLNGNLTFSVGMTWSHSSTFWVLATATLITAGKSFPGQIAIEAPGGTITLGDDLTVSGAITFRAGTFTTSASNYNITADKLNTSTASAKTISLNGSTVTLNGDSSITPQIGFDDGALTFNAGTSQINCLGNSATFDFRGGGKTFYNVSFTNTNSGITRAITGANTFNNLTITPTSSAGIALVTFAANQTINGTFTCAGATAVRRIFVRSDTLGTVRTLTVNSLSATDCDFRDITISGTASGSSPTRAGDCGGNSGITFPAAKTVYWNLAGTQNWSATAWATTNNGTPDINNFPLAQDTATFTDSGSAGTVSIQAFNISSIDMSSRTSAMTFSFASAATIYGNLTLGSGVTVSASGVGVQTFSGRGTQTINTAGKTIPGQITINSISGTVNLGADYTTSDAIDLTSGTFNAQTYNVTARIFASSNSNTRTLSMGSGTWTLSGTGTVWTTATTTNLTFNKGTANIVLSNTTTTARTFAGGSGTYNKLTIGGATGTSTLTVQGSNTFSEIDSTKTVAHTITFTAGTTTTVTTWSVKGTAGNVVTLNSSTAGSSYTLAKAGGSFLTGIDYLNIRDAIGSPISDTWYIGANSVINTTAPNSGYAMFTTQRADNAIVVLTSTSSTSWSVPADWNNAANSINLIGGGGGGAGSRVSGNNRAGGGGGGGGGFTRLTNQTLSGSITYQCGTAGAAGAAGADGAAGVTTSWNSGAATAGGGGGGQATTTPTSTGGTAGSGSTFNGGAGGAGSTSTAASTGNGGGGGGGAGGPNGAGGNGGVGFASTTAGNIAAGGGGGNGGGTSGGNASSATGGTGGNNSAGAGGGASNTGGAVGGGGGGSVSGSSAGGNGIDIFGIGGGGGAGGADDDARTSNIGGFYGGGGGGAGIPTAGTQRAAAAGRQGAIIIVYTPSGGAITGSSAISAIATVSTAGLATYSAASSISASSTVSATGGFTLIAGSAISAYAIVSVDGTVFAPIFGAASISANATLNANGIRIFDGQSSIFSNAILNASGFGTFGGQSAISASATLSALGSKFFFADSTILCNATVSSAGLLEKIGFAVINGVATATASAQYTASGSIVIQSDATVIPSGNAIFSSESLLGCFATMIPNGRIIGDEWSPVAPEANTWNDVNVGSNVWTEVQPGDNTWLRQG